MVQIKDIKRQLTAIALEVARLETEDQPDQEIIEIYRKKASRLVEQLAVETYAENFFFVSVDELCNN